MILIFGFQIDLILTDFDFVTLENYDFDRFWFSNFSVIFLILLILVGKTMIKIIFPFVGVWFSQFHCFWRFSGKILACHAGRPGSTPGQGAIFFYKFFQQNYFLYFTQTFESKFYLLK